MSGIDSLRVALYGDPPSSSFKPTQEGVLAAIEELRNEYLSGFSGIGATNLADYQHVTKSAADTAASGYTDGKYVLVWGDADEANNDLWLVDTGALVLTGTNGIFHDILAALAQPYIDAAETSANEAAASAASLTNAINQSDSLKASLLAGAALIGPSIDRALLQANGGILMDFSDSIFRVGSTNYATFQDTGIASCTRATAAYALDAAGTYQLFAADTLRATDLGLLTEGAATQILPQPVDYTAADWVKGNCTAAVHAGGAPFADTVSSYNLTESTTDSGISSARASFSATSGTSYAFSVLLKKSNLRYCHVVITGMTTRHLYVDFDTATTGQVDSQIVPSDIVLSELSSDWFLLTFYATAGSTATTFLYLYGATGTTVASRTRSLVTGTTFLEVGPAQIETGKVSTSPILAGSATRASDAASIAIPDGNATDVISIAFVGGSEKLTRSTLASPTSIDLINDGSGAWLGKSITSLIVTPAFDETLIAVPEGASSVYALEWDGTFYWDGAAYVSAGDMRAAAGITEVAGVLRMLGYVAPDAPDLLADVDFGSSVSGFVATNGSSASIDNGYLKMLATGAAGVAVNQAVSREMVSKTAKSFKFSATLKTGTTLTGGSQLAISNYSSGMNTAFGSSSFIGTYADTEVSVVGGCNFGSFWVGMRQVSGGGDTYIKDLSLKEIRPARNFPTGSYAIEVKGNAPSTLPGSGLVGVLWSRDNGSAIDRHWVQIDENGDVTLQGQLSNGTATTTLDLGTLSAGEAYHIVAGFDYTYARGALNGGDPVEAFLSYAPGLAYFRLGSRYDAGSAWTGTIDGYRIIEGLPSGTWMSRRTGELSGEPNPGVWSEGDSWTVASTGTHGFLLSAGLDVVRTGVGGSTLKEQYLRIINATNLANLGDRTLVWWDGSENDREEGCVFTGSISGTTLTVDAVTSGTLVVDQLLSRSDGSIEPETFILSQLTGTTGGVGTYLVSVSQTASAASTSAWMELVWIKDVISQLGHSRWLFLRSGRIRGNAPGTTTPTTDRPQDSVDMESIANALIDLYGEVHVCDPWERAVELYTGTPGTDAWIANQSDISFGYYPRDLMMDTFHLLDSTRAVIVPDVIVPAIKRVQRL